MGRKSREERGGTERARAAEEAPTLGRLPRQPSEEQLARRRGDATVGWIRGRAFGGARAGEPIERAEREKRARCLGCLERESERERESLRLWRGGLSEEEAKTYAAGAAAGASSGDATSSGCCIPAGAGGAASQPGGAVRRLPRRKQLGERSPQQGG
jgi:hypothetical protein